MAAVNLAKDLSIADTCDTDVLAAAAAVRIASVGFRGLAEIAGAKSATEECAKVNTAAYPQIMPREKNCRSVCSV